MHSSFQSEHFVLHFLAEGMYAAIATEMGAGYSNAGLIDLGGRTLVFDAFENPLAAEDLSNASVQLTGRKPAVAILSHFHPNHWGGMQVFADCPILATEATRAAMLPIVKEMTQDQRNPASMEKELQATEARLAAETDPLQKKFLQIAVNRQRYDLQTLPTLQPTLPNQTFEGRIVFHGTKRSAELIATGKGHTLSDCILHLRKDRIAFIGDLGFFQAQPFMPYGFPCEWIALLEELAGGKTKTFIPGHGPLGGKSDLRLEAEYLRALENMVEEVIRRGGKLKDALNETLPTPFDAWQAVGRRFESNVRGSFKRQRRQAGDGCA
jgi:glyoxylase-like metal-dependent hydrolase (beta-lactamase superfamily II)